MQLASQEQESRSRKKSSRNPSSLSVSATETVSAQCALHSAMALCDFPEDSPHRPARSLALLRLEGRQYLFKQMKFYLCRHIT